MKEILNNNSKPETLKEKLEDLWFYISCFYPRKIRDGWWALLRFFRNLKRYWKVLWEDNDFDQGYLEELILKKLSFMADYFREARIVVDEEEIYHQINLALRVGKIAFDISPEEDNPDEYGGEYGFSYLGYVNTRNYKRFWPCIEESGFKDPKMGMDYKTELRRLKAKHLFYRILTVYSSRWWD